MYIICILYYINNNTMLYVNYCNLDKYTKLS